MWNQYGTRLNYLTALIAQAQSDLTRILSIPLCLLGQPSVWLVFVHIPSLLSRNTLPHRNNMVVTRAVSCPPPLYSLCSGREREKYLVWFITSVLPSSPSSFQIRLCPLAHSFERKTKRGRKGASRYGHICVSALRRERETPLADRDYF